MVEKSFVTVETKGTDNRLDLVTLTRYTDGEVKDKAEVNVQRDGGEVCCKTMLPFLGTVPVIMFDAMDFERLNLFYQFNQIIFRIRVLLINDVFKEKFPTVNPISLEYIAKQLETKEDLASIYLKLEEKTRIKFITRHMGGERQEIVLTEGRKYANYVQNEINKLATAAERKEKYLTLVAPSGKKRRNKQNGEIYSANEGFRDIEMTIMSDMQTEADNKKYEAKLKRKKLFSVVAVCIVTAVVIYLIL